MSSEVELCPNCLQPFAGKKSGTLTQWIFVCNCVSLESCAGKDDKSLQFQVCRRCKKRINLGRDGSLTQFVFRVDCCRCERPDTIDVAIVRSSVEMGTDGVPPAQIFSVDFDDSEELDLSKDAFPIDRFKPLREIGKGSSGAVYSCRDRLLGTMVAVKMLRHLTAEQLFSFQQEARAIARLTHTNIVKILDFGVIESGIPYMVLEYIDGFNLEQLLERHGKLDPNFVVEIISSLCDALSYSHSKEIYHRDLKPSNILIVDGTPVSAKLVDFGIARMKFETTQPVVVQGTTIAGTPAYMSPDQMNGIPYDHRSEIYSLGCVFFELLTGRQVFSGASALETISMHANCSVPRLNEIDVTAEYPEELDNVLARCLAKQPQERYQSMDELKRDLETSFSVKSAHKVADRRADRKIKLSRVAIIIACLGTICGATCILQFFSSFKDDSTTSHKADPEVRAKKPGAFGSAISETKFQIKDFQGRPWWFNVAPVDDEALNELSLQKKVKRIFFDSLAVPPDALLKLKPLKLLGIGFVNGEFTREHFDNVAQLDTLTAIALYDTANLSEENLLPLTKLPALEKLFLRSEYVTDGGIARLLPEMKKLNTLSLDRCTQLTDRCIPTIAKIPGLQRLSVARSSVTSDGIRRIAGLKNLKVLSLAKLPVDSACINELTKLQQLERLSLRYTTISPADLMRLSQIKTLTFLDLRDIKTISMKNEQEFHSTRSAKRLAPCLILGKREMEAKPLNAYFGELLFETQEDERMWAD